MKLDDFECEHCGNKEEKLYKKNEDVKCSKCGESMKKVIGSPSGTGAHLSWSSWRVAEDTRS